MENKDTHAFSSQTNNGGHCARPWHTRGRARHEDGSKTAGRIPVASSPFFSSSQDNFLLQLGHKKVAALVGGPGEVTPRSPLTKICLCPFCRSGPHTTQLTGRAHMKQIHREFEAFHYFYILKLRASHKRQIEYNKKDPNYCKHLFRKKHWSDVFLLHHTDRFLLLLFISAAQEEPVKEDTAATAQAACVAGGLGATAIPLPDPRCCNLLQLFHNCLVSYYWSGSCQIVRHRLEQMEDLRRRPFAAPLAQLCS